MLKYMAEHSWRDEIRAVEVDKETESSVWISGRRRPKIAQSATFHDTWDEAHAYLTAIADGEVMRCRSALDHAKSRAGNIKRMKRPADQSN
ncbi:hypothetical protein DSD19_06360 [Rhodovulum sp. BSW8]|uniref:hypothetical protein n=1 Tax=Rhodovulum sp. BSW8 TaxID=2259645 RepID=UPI000DE34A9A|nr:hypothetical protein [Rhodovulum sp. BSW8]RBO54080.1 hypothetical protein DSD19_06360 [Rhodovulum sp. BSW8]